MQPLRDMVLERSSNEPRSEVGVPGSAQVRSLTVPPREDHGLDALVPANDTSAGLDGGALPAAAHLAPAR
jgi:hypothetical protein